jgi:predicted nucleic acid-binding protein
VSVLLDSSVLVDVLRGHQPALRFVRALDQIPFCSEITRVEIVRGLRSGERSRASRLLRSLRWAAVDEAIAQRAGELGRVHRRSHVGLATADLIIGATAKELGLDLATCNVRHFPMFKDLQPPYPA